MTLSERIARGPDPVTVRCDHCGGTYLPRDLQLLRSNGYHGAAVPAGAAVQGSAPYQSPFTRRALRSELPPKIVR